MSETATLLSLAKLHLRVRSSAFDLEISGLIDAGKEDLRRRGIAIDTLLAAEIVNPLAVRAVMLFCKAHFGQANTEHETARNETAYEQTAQALSLGEDYRESAVI